MKNQRGIVDPFTLLAIVAVIGAVLFIPNNPVGNALGVTQKPNKTVQTDATTQTILPVKADGETLYHADGSVVMMSQAVYKKEDLQIQQKVTFWEQLRGLNTVFVVLVIAGMMGVPGCVIFWNLLKKAYTDLRGWKGHTREIVLGVDAGLRTLPDENAKKIFKAAMAREQSKYVQDVIVPQLQRNSELPKGV